MGFWDVREIKKNEKEPRKRVVGCAGSSTFKCPSCDHVQKFHGYFVHWCGECGQEVAVCNVYWQCDLSRD